MTQTINPRKAAIIGCGFVGSATAFTLMQSRLFSELVLLDANEAKADGEAKDIAHGIPFAGQMKIYAGTYDDIADSAIIIITAVAFGPEAGFLTGALTAFVSNFIFGQGPWTPWQMFSWGMIGFLAGLLRQGLQPDRVGPARRRVGRAVAGPHLHLRSHVPRREFQYSAPCVGVLDDRAGGRLL